MRYRWFISLWHVDQVSVFGGKIWLLGIEQNNKILRLVMCMPTILGEIIGVLMMLV